MNTSCLKVTVNGKKYLITGIRKDVSRKDVLCALAKSSENAYEKLKQEFYVATQRLGHNEKLNSSKNEVNLLNLLKSDRETAGDLESLKILTSLGKSAKIIKRDSFNSDFRNEASYDLKNRSKRFSTESKPAIPIDAISKKKAEKSRVCKRTSIKKVSSLPKPVRAKHKSVDDSDIDLYKQPTLTRIKKRHSRCYDDSDLAVYNSLFHIILDQTVRLRKTHKQSKDFIKKMSWTEEIKNDYQLYYIDDDNSQESNASQRNLNLNVCGNDDVDNDSGLPSPEYDSSESQENPPIAIKKTISNVLQKNDNYLTSDERIETDNKNSYVIDKHDGDFSVNKSQQINILNEEPCILQNSSECFCAENEERCNVKIYRSNDNKQSSDDLNTEDTLGFKLKRSQSLGDLLKDSHDESGKQELKSSSSLLNDDIAITLRSGSLDEENIVSILNSTTCNGRKALRVMGVMNESVIHNTIKSKKKHGKKKICKSDISDPQLLSPSRFRRYGSLRSVQAALKREKNVSINNESIGRSVTLPVGEKDEESKDKEKFYNKKLKEIRSKRSKCDKSDLSESRAKLKDKHSDKRTNDKTNSKENKYSSTLTPKCDENETLRRNSKDNKDKSKHFEESERLKNSSENVLTTATGRENGCNEIEICKDSKCINSAELMKKNEANIDDIEKRINELNKLKGPRSDENSRKHTCHLIDSLPRQLERSSETNNSCDIYSGKTRTEHCEKMDKFDGGDQLETTSDYSSLSENIKLEGIDEIDVDRHELIAIFTKEEEDLYELVEKILDYNLMISLLSEELDIVVNETDKNVTLDNLIAEEENVYREISNVRSLLNAVTDLCSYQRKEISDNLALLDTLDSKVRTKKAGYEILKSGQWRTNLNHAPRSLLKHSKEKSKASAMAGKRNSSSV